MNPEDQIANLQSHNELLKMELRAMKAEKNVEYQRAEKLKAQNKNQANLIETLRRRISTSPAEQVFKNG